MRFLAVFLTFWVILCAHAPFCVAKNLKKTELFQIDSVIFTPSAVFTQMELLSIAAPYMGRNATRRDINQLIDNINKIYADRGYLFATASLRTIKPIPLKAQPSHFKAAKSPKTTTKPHQINIMLNEMTVTAGDNSNILSLPAAAFRVMNNKIVNRPLNPVAARHHLSIINEIPGLSVKATILKSAEMEGAASPNGNRNLYLKTQSQQRVTDSLFQIDNETNDPKNAFRVLSDVRAYAVLPYLEMIGARGAEYSGNDNIQYGEIYTETWLGSSGLRWKNRFGILQSEGTSADLGFLSQGNSRLFESEFVYPYQDNLKLSAGIKSIKTESAITGLNLFKDDIVTSILGAEYSQNINENRHKLSFILTQSLTKNDEANKQTQSRTDADLMFTKLNTDYEFIKNLPYRDAKITANATAQYSFSPMLAGEEFTLGGGEYGRGYTFGSLTGDDGVGVSVEAGTPSLFVAPLNFRAQAYGFIDGGMAHEKSSAVTDEQFKFLASAGMGARFKMQNTHLQFEWARPITSNDKAVRDEAGTRLTFRLSGGF